MSIEKKINLKKDEKIVNVVRRYGLTFFWEFIVVLFLFVVPFFFMFWLFRHSWWGIGIFSASLLLGLIILIKIIFLWKKNVLILTTHRLVDFDRRGFFEQIISDIPYDQIEDVHGKVKGIAQTIFKYGNVNIQTGEGQVLVTVDRVKNPVFLGQQINRLREYYLTHLRHHFSGNLADAVIDKLYELEIEDLEKIKIVIEKRIKKLSN
ncbi:MAG: hypothetical protein US42_C0009G0004 [Candidatus Magasanikbacteria bacterium GW2011_GWC2_37_14]|uniref:YdbS-like PH domain-containing protein n=1 Tax=Candidatus Magasanikbacteria bacterium GW2011_GWC2_37_14 TaxID=1619046 RepID=A0A0G0ITA8_9BACT|nr:MAG: hypothetical protein US42_C0009G0004 [Candidatus Magasanikbacteria bacterium GW2011_GWC2_37_14]